MIDYASIAVVLGLGTRPRNSPGWGMVKCVKSGVLKSRDGKEVTRVIAGTTRCAPDYWAVRDWPEYFMPIDSRDVRTRDMHERNLERTRRDLERGLPSTRTRSSSGALRLPRHTGRTFKLPPRA
jgi:hypothetical protein